MSGSELTPRGATEGISATGDARPVPIRIEAVEGPGAGASLNLTGGLLTVGSHASCDLVLSDPAVSRQHATLELLQGAVRVRDLNSRNGTRYLGARITEAKVPVGGALVIGRTTLQLVPVQADVEPSGRDELQGLIGQSVAMRRLFSRIERVAPQDVAVLIHGESGTGKDAVARALHALSPRAQQPFVVFDCAAVAASLVESELFGHARGAFTGASTPRAGAVQSADGGTLFLDEIGELPLELQPRLLRLLEAREYRPVGSDRVQSARVRIVAATHRDLRADVQAGRFRADLLHRLEGVTLVVPPLRERREDIPLLAARFARETTGVDVPLAAVTLAALQASDWPGNVRELRNAVQRAVLLGEFPRRVTDPSAPAAAPATFKDARDALMERFERDYLVALLREHAGNLSAAARKAGISRMTLYRLLEKHALTAEGV